MILFAVAIPFSLLTQYFAERKQSVVFTLVFSILFPLLSIPIYRKFSLSFEFYYFAFLLLVLMGIAYVDFLTEGIPQLYTHTGIVLGVIFSYFTKFPGLKSSLWGAGIGLVTFGILKLISDMMMRKESFGLGDIKLLTMIGAFGGPYLLLVGIVGGSFIGLIYAMWRILKTGEKRVPFGPFISLAAYLGIIFRPEILKFLQKILVS